MILGPLFKVDSKGKIRVYSIETDGARYRVTTGLEDGAKTTTKWTNTLPKNAGKTNATTAIEQATSEAKAKYDKKLKEHYFKTKEEATETIESYFKPMLASELKEEEVEALLNEYGYLLMDPKLDGMRLIQKSNYSKSRTGRDVPNARWIVEDLEPFFKLNPNIALDGEMYNHTYRDDFNGLMKLTRKVSLSPDQETKTRTLIEYHVYDMYDFDNEDMSAEDRKKWLELRLTCGPRVKLVRYAKVTTLEEFNAAHENNLSLGYEGSIVRIPTSPYKNGRGKQLLKYKQFKTAEFTIIDILAGRGNRSDIAGRVIVDVNGVEVGCGIRGDWDFCKELLENVDKYINKDATIRFFNMTEDGSLRFPICIDVDRWKHE